MSGWELALTSQLVINEICFSHILRADCSGHLSTCSRVSVTQWHQGHPLLTQTLRFAMTVPTATWLETHLGIKRENLALDNE